MNLNAYFATALLAHGLAELRPARNEQVFYSRDTARDAIAEILDIPSWTIPIENVALAAQLLEGEGIVGSFETPHAAPRYEINYSSIDGLSDVVAQKRNVFENTYWLYEKLGRGWLQESAENALRAEQEQRSSEDDEDIPFGDDTSSIVPAADRYVLRSDNAKTFDEIRANLGALEEAISADNEASSEDREIALSEIAAFEATVIQSRISTDLIERFVRQILAWVSRVFSAALVSKIVEILAAALLRSIGLS